VFVRITKGNQELKLIAIHLITRLNDRLRQARTLRAWTQQLALQGNLIVLVDTNS
jgi:endonuclease/exonuclease/phosphatase family metal-dependent hydrolase